MKQVVQNYRSGELRILDVPKPQLRRSTVLVRSIFSAISAGTEKTKIDTARMTLAGKARSRPDLVKKVLGKIQKDGLLNTYQMVQHKLSEPVPLGYSTVGVVEEMGSWVEGLRIGDFVACAGAGVANHAEYNAVPYRLLARCPSGTPLDQASMTTIGSIALQGVRVADVKIGERVVVLGLGLLGQITAQLLRASGCSVFGIDLDPWKLSVAQGNGSALETALASDPALFEKVSKWSGSRGADAVILTASTPSNGPIEQAGEFCREKARVVIVGAVGTQFPREPYYLKEIDIRIARSYGPGRYDPLYEELGIDYPLGYVRFTVQRNMETFLSLLAEKKIDLSSLVTHRFPIEQAESAFDLLDSKKSKQNYLGILLEYPNTQGQAAQIKTKTQFDKVAASKAPAKNLGFIGLGNYATAQILPSLKKVPGLVLKKVVTGSGTSAGVKGAGHGFAQVAGTPTEVIESSDIGTVFILTRHDSHAEYVQTALAAGKNVFVEKPLCLYEEDLPLIAEAYDQSSGILMVGFNRRFSPLIQKVRKAFASGAEHILYRVNAGALPAEHWLKLPEVGGGRIIGEACHFVDLCSYLACSPVKTVYAQFVGNNPGASAEKVEDVHITLTMKNGSVASILYLSTGSAGLSKEYLEVHGGGKSAVIQDFMSMTLNGHSRKREIEKLSRQDKGQGAMLASFMQACEARDRNQSPIPIKELLNSTSATFSVLDSLCLGQPVHVTE